MSTKDVGASAPRDYRLKVENFGPIIAADVEFRPLTVFVGPSNTGKSYLAALLYSLHRNAALGEVLVDQSARREAPPVGAPEYEWPDSLVRGVRDWLAGPGPPPALPADLEAALQAACDEKLTQAVSHEVRRCFGISNLTDLKRWSSPAETTIKWEASPPARHASSLSIRISQTSHSASIGDLASVSPQDCQFWSQSLRTVKKEIKELWAYFLVTEVAKSVLNRGFGPMLKQAYHLPAERAGLVRHHEAVVRNLIRAASTDALRPERRSSPTLPGIAADFLERITAVRSAGEKRRHGVLGGDVEVSLLRGRIRVRPNVTGYPEFTYMPDTSESSELPLARTSSMVSDLASLALYLHNSVRPGDVLIIEEPEAHMHPEKQTDLVRFFARMIRSGVRVVITTHSEWLTEQIGNLVQLSALPEDRRTGIPNSEVDLSEGKVGVWLFREEPEGRGSVVEEVRIDPESGLFPTDYDRVSETLYNQNAAIFNRRQDD